MNDYHVGDVVRLTGAFTNAAGTATNPTTVVVTVRRRDGQTWTYSGGSVSNPATGTFYADHTVTHEGVYDYRIVGTGAVVAAFEGTFRVPDSQFF